MYKFLISYQFNTLTQSGFGDITISSAYDTLSIEEINELRSEIIKENKKQGNNVTSVIILNIVRLR